MGWKILNTVWVFQGLLADIVGLELGSLYKKRIACKSLPLPVVLFYKTRNFGNIHYRDVEYREYESMVEICKKYENTRDNLD